MMVPTCLWFRDGAVGLAVAISLLQSDPAGAQCQYDLTIINAPECAPFGLPATIALSTNEAGDVVGYYPDCVIGPDQPFVWTTETGLVAIAMPVGTTDGRAHDISDAGWIVGRMGGVISPRRGFLVDDDGIVDLGIPPGGTFSEALAINESGQIVGYWGNTVTGPSPLAVLWQDGVMIDLSLDFATPKSRANDINELGRVVGWMGSSSLDDAHAYIWENGAVTDLGPIPGGFTSEGRAINNQGHVAGIGRLTEGETVVRRAFFWTDGAMTDLGTLPGLPEAFAYGLNDVDQVVGFCWNFGQFPRAFIWQYGVMTDLNSLVPFDPALTIEVASAINNVGQISGWARNPNTVAVLLTPMERPVGDVDIDCQVGVLDLLMLLGAWGPCNNCAADLNSDGVVDVTDLLLLLINWG